MKQKSGDESLKGMEYVSSVHEDYKDCAKLNGIVISKVFEEFL